MRGFPAWLILALVVLSGLMLYVGNEELDKVGPVPLILGVGGGVLVRGRTVLRRGATRFGYA